MSISRKSRAHRMARPIAAAVMAGLLSMGMVAGVAAQAPTETTGAPSIDYWSLLFVFVLSSFIGLGIIRRVSRLLHTPLMSITNAISAIAVVGSIIIAGEQKTTFTTVLGAVAVFASMTNIISGFLITDRMLKMFKKRGAQKP